MEKRYAFLWHVISSEDTAASLCESAETEAEHDGEAEEKLRCWLEEQISNCDAVDCACKSGGVITEEITPKMIMAGMTQHMVKI